MGLDQTMMSSSGQKEFYWRKHARLQVFMARKWNDQNGYKGNEGALDHLGFNASDKPLILNRDLLDAWESEIEEDYYCSFASDGFFWGQQFQEEQVREYKEQDKEACDWARTQVEQGHQVTFGCSW
tara:strand:- start:56 stop:433 length:378 start_codon:yes stop_codon:yes gene_type:complete